MFSYKYMRNRYSFSAFASEKLGKPFCGDQNKRKTDSRQNSQQYPTDDMFADIMTAYPLRGKHEEKRAEDLVISVFVKHDRRDRKTGENKIDDKSESHPIHPKNIIYRKICA